MELQRLVIEDADSSYSVDFHPGLTVASSENPSRRNRFVEDVIGALGPGRSGLHLELLDGRGHPLVVFRPADARHRVIDTERALDVSAHYLGPDLRVDLLGHVGVDPVGAQRLLRVNANHLDRGNDTGTDNHRLARRLAAVDQDDLWTAAEQLAAAEARLNAAAGRLGAHRGLDRGAVDGGAVDREGAESRSDAAVDAARALQLAAEAHARTEAAARAHRSVLMFGSLVAGGCALVSAILFAFDRLLDDNRWTAKVLLVLAALALLLALWDRRGMVAVRRQERRLLATLGVSSYEAMRATAGPLADERRRHVLLDAAATYEPLAARWRLLSGGTPLHWALDHRPAIAALADRRRQAAPFLAADLATDESALADSARVLVDRVIQLQDVGMARERLPLVLDEPFIGLDAGDTIRLLETVRRLAASHQILLVTGNPDIEAWAARLAATSQAALVRAGRPPGEGRAVPPSSPPRDAPSHPTPTFPSDRTPSDRTPSDRTPSDRTPSDRTPSDRHPSDRDPSDPAAPSDRHRGPPAPPHRSAARAR